MSKVHLLNGLPVSGTTAETHNPSIDWREEPSYQATEVSRILVIGGVEITPSTFMLGEGTR